MSPTDTPFWDVVDQIRADRPRYRREAYGFVVNALGHTVRALPPARRSDPERRHLSGQELVHGVIDLARREFGILAPMVFREWGMLGSVDVGEIVFQLVESGQLSARAEDRREDFIGGPDLMTALSAGVDLGVPGSPTVRRPPGRAPGDPSGDPDRDGPGPSA